MVPYTGTISPRVEELRAGYARISMADRRRVRNHLGSIHAIAIMNLAEVTGGLALNYGLPADARAILTALSIEYTRKARGRLTAEAHVEIPATNERREYEFVTVVEDASGEEVARATLARDRLSDVRWRRSLNILGHALQQGRENPRRLEELTEWGEEHTEFRYNPEFVNP